MLEKKINSLKNVIFVKGSICLSLVLCSLWIISFLTDDYADALVKLEEVKPMIAETRLKLHEITDGNANIAEAVEKYNEIYGKTEEARCKEYQDLLFKIGELRSKYNLPDPINTTISVKPNKLNIVHNKASYIGVYDLKIEFSAYDIREGFEIYSDILSLLPQYTMIYFMDIKENSAVNLKNLSAEGTKAPLLRGKVYVRLRDVVSSKVRN